MTRSAGQRRSHLKNTRPRHPGVRPIGEWLSANRGLYRDFRLWLERGGYSFTALTTYSVAARLALGFLDKPYWQIDTDADLERVRRHIGSCQLTAATQRAYRQGLLKLAQFLRDRCQHPVRERQVNWEYYLASLPAPLQADIREYLAHCRRGWRPELEYRSSTTLLSCLTRSLRWMAGQSRLDDVADLTPERWFDYLDTRLAAKITPATLNSELRRLQNLVAFVAEQGRPICQRLLRLEPLDEGPRLPRDVPADQLRLVLREIESDARSPHAASRWRGVMDRAWFLLMLHCGLRSGEVGRLQVSDLTLTDRWVRIEQSKGLKDRQVCLSPATVAALRAFLDLRKPLAPTSDHVFVYRHVPLSSRYCQVRLTTYGRRCGVFITPHQLRHSCATLLLNAGAPIASVQALLGHEQINTTLRYARAYDSTVAADYYRAMAQLERQLPVLNCATPLTAGTGQLVALVDELANGTLTEAQRTRLHALRDGLVALAVRTGTPDPS